MEHFLKTIAWLIDKAGLAWLLGFLVGLFSDEIKKRLFRPKIHLICNNSAECISINQSDNNNYSYLRGAVVNESNYTAINISVYIDQIYIKDIYDHKFNKISYGDPLQLQWSAVEENKRCTPLSIQGGVTRYFDIAYCEEIKSNDGHNMQKMTIKSQPFPRRYADKIKNNSIYFVRIFIVGDNINKRVQFVEFEWMGKFDSFRIGKLTDNISTPVTPAPAPAP